MTTGTSPSTRRLLVAFFVLGAYAVVAQSVLLREFLVVSFGSELSWGLTFFGWLLGIALGAAVGGRVSRKESLALGGFVAAVALLAVVTPAVVYLVRISRGFFDVGPGEYLPLWTMLWLNPLLTMPVSFVIGFTFPLAAALAGKPRNDEEKTLAVKPPAAHGQADPIAKVYAVEAAGAIIGGALFSFVLVENVPAFAIIGYAGLTVLLATALLVAAFGPPGIGVPGSRTKNLVFVLFPAFLCAGAALCLAPALERWSTQQRWETFRTGTELVTPSPVDSRYQNITLAKRENEYSVFLDGLKAMTFPDPTTHAAAAHFVMCEAKNVKRVLVIGGGIEGVISEMLKHPVARLDYVTLDPKMADLVRERLGDKDRNALDDPRVAIHYDDGRHFLKAPGEHFDLVFMDMPEPSSLLLNRFYTREFFALAARRLAPDGLVAFRLTASPSYFSETRRQYLASIWKALGGPLPERLATWGEQTFILASPSKGVFTENGAELVKRYCSRGVASQNFDPAWFEGATDMLTPANIERIRGEIEKGEGETAANTDERPRAYLYNLILWDRIVGGKEHSTFEMLGQVRPWAAVTGVLAATLLWLGVARRPMRRRLAESATLYSVATTGLASMALELVLLVVFQSLYGYVYARVGIIVGVFMLGLVAGSLAVKRLLRTRPALGMRALAALDVVIAAFAILVPLASMALYRLPAGACAGLVEWCIMTLVLVSGALGGAIFPLSAKIAVEQGKSTGRAAGSVDAADNAGACLGALVAGVVLVPVLGLFFTCALLALLKLLSAALLVLASRTSHP